MCVTESKYPVLSLTPSRQTLTKHKLWNVNCTNIRESRQSFTWEQHKQLRNPHLRHMHASVLPCFYTSDSEIIIQVCWWWNVGLLDWSGTDKVTERIKPNSSCLSMFSTCRVSLAGTSFAYLQSEQVSTNIIFGVESYMLIFTCPPRGYQLPDTEEVSADHQCADKLEVIRVVSKCLKHNENIFLQMTYSPSSLAHAAQHTQQNLSTPTCVVLCRHDDCFWDQEQQTCCWDQTYALVLWCRWLQLHGDVAYLQSVFWLCWLKLLGDVARVKLMKPLSVLSLV